MPQQGDTEREREVKMRANISSPGVCCNQQTNGLYSWRVFILQQGAANKSLPMSVWKYSTSLPLFRCFEIKKELLTNTALGI